MASSAVQCERAIITFLLIISVLCIFVLFIFSLFAQMLCGSTILLTKHECSSCQREYSLTEGHKQHKEAGRQQQDNNNKHRQNKTMNGQDSERKLICSVQLLTISLLRALFLLTFQKTEVNATIVSSTLVSGTHTTISNSLHDNSYASNEYFIHNQNHPDRRSASLSLWPRPLSHSTGTAQYLLSRSVQYLPAEQISDCDIITEALKRYSSLLNGTIYQLAHQPASLGSIYDSKNSFGYLYKQLPKLDTVHLLISESVQCSDYPDFITRKELSENYSIEIRPTNRAFSRGPRGLESTSAEAVLLSPTLWGLLRALETFSQLFYPSDVSLEPDTEVTHAPELTQHLLGLFINITKIEDKPKYPYRGLMIDTARHFIPPKLLIKNLEAMSYSKLNTMHWHLSDDQAFSFSSIHLMASKVLSVHNNEQSNYGHHRVYSRADVQSIVDAGRLRGIQIIPEIDTPSHSKVLSQVRPELFIHCPNSGSVQLNPILDESHEFVGNLFHELAQVLSNLRVHIGHDDVSHRCWLANKAIQQFMSTHSLTTGRSLEQYYIEKLSKKLATFSRYPIIWQDPLDNDVSIPNGTIVQIWKDTKHWEGYSSWETYARRITEKSHSIILSSCWFLSEMKHAKDWTDFYACNPESFTQNSAQKKLLLGGEACLWSDYIDATNFMPILWPRAAAVAERLWSENVYEIFVPDVQRRLAEHRCRLLRRGIAAQPIQPGFCDYFDWDDHEYSRGKTYSNSYNNDGTVMTELRSSADGKVDSIKSKNVQRIVGQPILGESRFVDINTSGLGYKPTSSNELRINGSSQSTKHEKETFRFVATSSSNPIFLTNLDQSWSWRLVSEGQSLESNQNSFHASTLANSGIQFYHRITYQAYSWILLLTYFVSLTY